MKKFLISLIAFAVIAPASMAQSGASQSYISSPLGSNWEVSVGLGTQFYMGEADWKASFLEWWAFPALDLNLSKWVTPVFGFGVELGGGKFKGLYSPSNGATFSNQGDPVHSSGFRMCKGWYLNPNINLNVNLVNLFAGYRPDRKYNLVAEIGAGADVSLGWEKTIWATTFNARLRNQFSLNDKLKLNLTVGGSLVGDDFDGESYATSVAAGNPQSDNIGLDGTFAVTAGITYGFNFSKKSATASAVASAAAAGAWVSLADVEENVQAVTEVEQAKVAEAKEDSAKLEAELEAARKAAADAQKAADEAKALADAAKADADRFAALDVTSYVNFVIGTWTLSNREMINVQNLAALINQLPGTKFVITGYADKATGSAKRNLLLSKNRAETVYKALTQKYGVNPDQLSVESKGGVAPMFFKESALSRSVIVTVVK